MRDEKSHWLKERSVNTLELEKSPYDSESYLQRALCYEKLGFPDLAASDAYRALLLTDEVLDEEGEYHDRAVEALGVGVRRESVPVVKGLAKDGMKAHTNSFAKDETNGHAQNHGLLENNNSELKNGDQTEEPWYETVAKGHARRCYEVLARMLSECGDLKGAFDFAARGLMIFSGNERLPILKEQILRKYHHQRLERDTSSNEVDFNPREDLPENGSVRREIYPWNEHEPDRFSEENLSFINAEIKKSGPKCEVRAIELPILAGDTSTSTASKATTIRQLGIFTTSAISPKQTVLLEPSVLTSSTRLHDPFCDACSTRLPPFSLDKPLHACQNCEDIVFCSAACHDRAQLLYHPAICGVLDFDVVAKDPSPFAATSCLYTLLLARTMAMAETQNLNPLDLPQIKYLWGDFTDPKKISRTLPFSFENNIQQPLHLLTSLSLDLFAPATLARYDTWIINTLLSKFRGVANAKMNERTGIPEVAGVHWLWSLANHSCAPNVRWEWEKGGMGFVARGGDELVRWGPSKEEDGEGKWDGGGIQQGEEVLNHYCDVDLDVRQRREWAVGALGGMCVCERCIWEEGEEMGEAG